MDFKKRKIHSLQGLIVLILFILPAAASTNINCDGRAFHCINSTHFIICVDVGGGQSKTIDNFVIPCPPTTECKMNNRLECEFPPVTLPMPLFEPLKSTIRPIIVDTTILPQHSFVNTESPQNVPEITTDNYFNTVSPTTVPGERINATEATFAINDNTISNINEITVAPQLTTRYIDNEFMISTNAQHTTKNPIDEIRIGHTTAETTLYEFSSLQSIGTVTDATIDMKTNQDLLEYAAQNKIEYFNNETNIQPTPGVYVTGSTISSTFVNTTKMAETINPHVSELTSINDCENNTSIPSKSMDLPTESSNLIANKITSTSSGKVDTSETLSITNTVDKKYSGLLSNDAVTTNPNMNRKSYMTGYELPIQSTLKDKGDITTEIIIPRENRVTFRSTGMEISSKTLITTLSTEKNDSTLLPNKLTTTLPSIESIGTPVDVTTNILPVTDGIQQNHSPVFLNNTEITTSNNNLAKQSSSVNEGFIMVDATMESTVSTVTDLVSENSGKVPIVSDTLFTTDVMNQNCSNIASSDKVTIGSNILTSSDVISNNLPTQSSNIHEVKIMHDASMQTIVSTVTETAFVDGQIGVNSNTQFTTDGLNQNYTYLTTNNTATTALNIATSHNVSTGNKLSTQSSSINEVVVMPDTTMETTVSIETDITSVNNGTGVTSKTPFTTDVFKQNHSAVNTNNIVTTSPNIATSSAVSSNNKFPTKGLSTNEVVTKSNATTETTVSTVTEITSVNSGIDVTSETPSVTDVFKQNYSDININNIVTTAPNNATSSAVSSNNKLPIQGSSTNAVVTLTDATTETTVSTINDRSSINSGIGFTSETPFATDVFKQNESDINTNNTVTNAPNVATSSAVSSNYNLPTQGSSTNEVVTFSDATTETTLSTINDRSSINSGIGVISETPFVTDVFKQNHSAVNTNNIVTTSPNIATSSVVSSNNNFPTKSLSTNEVVTKSNATTETTVSTVTEITSVNSGIDVTSETPFVTDVFKQNYSDINVNNIVTTAPNNAKSSAVSSNNKSTTQGSSTNAVVTLTDATTETTVSTINDRSSINSGIGFTSETPFATDVFKQNESDINTNNTVTNAPNVATSSAVSSNYNLPTQVSSTNEVVTFSDATTETTLSTINDRSSINSGIGVISETPFVTDVFKQNHSAVNTNNIVTTSPNIATSSVVSSNNKFPTKSLSTNEVVTKSNATTETTVSTVTEITSVNSGIDVTSETPFVTDVFKQNYSDINVNNIVTTAPNNAKSSAVSSNNKSTTQGSSTNAVVTFSDAPTETTVSTINDRASINSGIGVTSETPFPTDVFKQNYSDINTNNIVTAAPNIATSSAVFSNNKSPTQGSSTNAVVTLTDATTETTLSTINDRSSINSGIGVTSEIPFATDVFKQNESDINTNNIVTTAPNIATSSVVSSNNKLRTQGSSTNAVVTLTDATTETTVSIINDRSSINSRIGVTSETPIATDVFKQNESDINTNNTVTNAPNVATSSAVSSNYNLPTQGSSTNEVVTFSDATTETTLSTINDRYSINSEIGVISETPFVTDVFKQNYSDINTNNIVTTAPNNATSLAVSSNNKFPTQGLNTNEAVTMLDATTETMVSTVTEITYVNSGIEVTSETPFVTDVFNQNYSDITTNDIVTTTRNIATSSVVSSNNNGSSTNEVVIMSDATTETMVSIVTEITSVNSEIGATSETLFPSDVFKQNYSDLITDNIVTTISNVFTSLDVQNNTLPTTLNLEQQGSSLNEIFITPDTNMKIMDSTVTVTDSIYSGQAVVTTKTLFTTGGIKKNYSVITNNVATTIPSVVTISDELVNKDLLIQSSSLNEAVITTGATKETITPTATAIVSVSNTADVTTGNLFSTEAFKKKYSDILINNKATTVPDMVTSFDNSINKKLSTKTSTINQTGTTAETIKEITSTVTSTISESNTKETITPTVTSTVSESSNKETITPTVTATVSVSNTVDVTSRALFTTAVFNQNDIIINNKSTAIPDIVTNSYAVNWTPLQKSSTHEVNTRSTNAFTDIRFDQHDYSNVKPTSHESLVTTDVSLNVEDSIKSERKIERRKNTTSPDTNFKNKQSSSEGNTRLMINDFPKSNLTDDGHLNIAPSGNEVSSVTTLLLNTSAQENVFRTQNENYQTMDSNIQIYNISNKNTQNRSKINAEIQSNIINNMPNIKQRNSYNINNSYRNTDHMRNTKFTCLRRARGRYADGDDCRKFYICIGREEPITGICPFGTVFSEIRKQCTNNLSHCIRNHQFRCTSVGRFSGSLQNNVYYICVEDESGKFIRFNFHCQNGYYLNKTSVLCSPRIEDTSQSVSSSSDSSNTDGDQSAIKFSSHDSSRSASSVFQCKREGKFADPSNCRRYYECSRSRKLGYKIKRKICDDDQIFNKDRKKCVDDESLES